MALVHTLNVKAEMMLSRLRFAPYVPAAPHTDIVETPLAMMRVRRQGRGEKTVVFACDPPNQVEHYDQVCELFGRHYQVLVIEYPGFGFSRVHDPRGYSFDGIVECFAEVIKSQASNRCILALSCVGSYISLALARRLEDRIAGIVAMQAPSWEEERKWAKRLNQQGLLDKPLVGPIATYLARQRIADHWYGVACADAGCRYRLKEQTRRGIAKGAQFALSTLFQACFYRPFDPQLADPQLPAAILWGTADRSHRLTDRSSSKALLPDASCHELAEVGHFPELEAPQAVLAAIERFAP